MGNDLQVQLMKEFNLRAAALKKSGEEIIELRRQVQLLNNENAKLRSQLEHDEHLANDVRRNPPPAALEKLGSAELALRLQTALQKYHDEKFKSKEAQQRLDEALHEVSRGRGLGRTLEELQRAHQEQNVVLQKLQDENKKIDLYRQTVKSQEKVISKLERILEGSLEEVQGAQRTQVDMDRLKTENVRLREQCANVAARRRYQEGGEDDAVELRRQTKAKDEEIARLEALVFDLQGGNPTTRKDAAESQVKLGDLEAEKFQWKQRCEAVEQRLHTMERQLSENSRHYGQQISDLKLEIAKREARVLELELTLKDLQEAS